MVVTITVIVLVVILQVASAVVGIAMPFLAESFGASIAIISIVNILLHAVLYAVVAGGAGLIARTATGRAFGIGLPLLAWLLSTAFWYGLVQQVHFHSPVVIGLLTPLFVVMVLAGWGCAAWAGRRWLIGLPITYVLLIAVQAPLSLALAPAMSFDNIAAAQILSAASIATTTVVMILGGVLCWLLARSERSELK